MDHNKEYHDPDYPEAAISVKEEPPSISEEEKVEKIKSIIRREFLNELEVRENEVMLIDQRMATSRRLLHRLRYSLVTRYYMDQKLHLSNGQIQDEIAAQKDPRARAEVASLLRDGQRQLHPSVRKLLGKHSVDIDEIFRSRGPRNKTRKDYVAMLQKRNYTISADSTKSLRPVADEAPEPCGSQPSGQAISGQITSAQPSLPKKVPRQIDPKITNVVTLDEATRNKMKHRYRIIIGNTSKYVPPASRLDRSTHKWLLYVRGARDVGDVSPVVTAVTVTLHHSYAPHHVVHLDKPPFHITRRGWGEFPARVQLHFPLPARNPPAAVQHTIKLDRNYTGVQMLGSETIVDVWLYSTQDMLEHEYKEDDDPAPTQANNMTTEQTETLATIKTEDNSEQVDDNWMDFFTKAPTELDVDEMIIKPVKKENIVEPEPETNEDNGMELMENSLVVQNDNNEVLETKVENILEVPNEIFNQPPSIKKRIVKYIDPITGKIYYLEMDRELDLTKVQEIVINNTTAKISPIKSNGLKNVRRKKGGVSLLKPEVKSLLKSENIKSEKAKPNLAHIENDHCYLAAPKSVLPVIQNVVSEVEVKKEKSFCSVMHRFSSVRAAVNYLVKHIPLITDEARDPDYVKRFPFVVESSEKYWKLDFAKRRNIEWSRAKLINKILTSHFRHSDPVWRTKQILLYIRLHGHYPVREECTPVQQYSESEWSSWGEDAARRPGAAIRDAYPDGRAINTLSLFNWETERTPETYTISDDEDVDVTGAERPPAPSREPPEPYGLVTLPVEADEDRLRYLYVERTCQDIGIELRNEDVGNGYSYSAVHAVLLSALRSFAEELVRSALAAGRTRRAPPGEHAVWTGYSSSKTTISLTELYAACNSTRLRVLTSRDMATQKKTTTAL